MQPRACANTPCPGATCPIRPCLPVQRWSNASAVGTRLPLRAPSRRQARSSPHGSAHAWAQRPGTLCGYICMESMLCGTRHMRRVSTRRALWSGRSARGGRVQAPLEATGGPGVDTRTEMRPRPQAAAGRRACVWWRALRRQGDVQGDVRCSNMEGLGRSATRKQVPDAAPLLAGPDMRLPRCICLVRVTPLWVGSDARTPPAWSHAYEPGGPS